MKKSHSKFSKNWTWKYHINYDNLLYVVTRYEGNRVDSVRKAGVLD